MIFYAFLSLIGVFMMRALSHWRSGILLIILLAAMQDPVRKIVPGTPGFMALATAPVFLALIFASVLTTRGWWREFRRSFPVIGKALLALIILSIPAAAISLTYGAGSWQLTLMGGFSYAVIFLAIIAGFHYAKGRYSVERLLGFYCIVHGVMLTGGLFEYFGWFANSPLLGDEAMGFNWLRYETGYIVEIICGFYRSGDVMGWHAVAVCCLSIILASNSRGLKRLAWVGLAAFAVFALLLCGRRKMVYMLPLFVVALGWIYWQAGRKLHRASLVGLIALPFVGLMLVGGLMGEDNSQVHYYTSTADQTFSSLEGHGFTSLVGTYEQAGFFGAGLGTATPGSHHLNVERPHTWQESGPSRVLVELGVPGAIGFLVAILTIIAAMWRETLRLLKTNSPAGPYSAGLVAFFVANVGSLTVSGQILADPFIAVFLGLLVGLVLASARLHPAPGKSVAAPPPPRFVERPPLAVLPGST